MADEEKLEDKPFSNALRLAGDTLIAPGTSLIIDGKIADGAAHVAVGIAARAVFGPIGWLAVAADAYAKSTTGTSLLDHVFKLAKKPAAGQTTGQSGGNPPTTTNKNPDMNATY